VADLERDLVADETSVRVAVHFLENAGLLWRGFDLPRSASLTLRIPANGGEPDFHRPGDTEFARFVQVARLRSGQRVSRDLVAVSQEAQLDPRAIEPLLLEWHDAGRLRYRGTGRDMLLALPEPPADSQQRVSAMLADYHAGQDGRLAEMMAYATTARCRHGHISAYFGGRPIERCTACDNCLQTASPSARPQHPRSPRTRRKPRTHLPSEQTTGHDAARTILEGVARLPYPLGISGLARALQGAETSPVKADRFPGFGVLANCTQKDIRSLIAHLVDQGMLAQFHKGRYPLLRLSDRGRAWLSTEGAENEVSLPPPSASLQDPTEYDLDLFQALRDWRLATAHEMGKPPFVVLHDAVLKRIAAIRPTNTAELNAIKGIGPRKLELYGPSILSIIAEKADPSHKQEE
jgi:ATP-dependent DNA helicase RecQ